MVVWVMLALAALAAFMSSAKNANITGFSSIDQRTYANIILSRRYNVSFLRQNQLDILTEENHGQVIICSDK